MKILVTGGCGFIGSHLIDKLLEENNEIINIDNKSGGKYINNRVKNIEADVTFENVQEYFKGVDMVFHLAADPMVNVSAEKPKKSFKDNVVGTFNILEACRKNDIKKIVFTSTSTVYGESKNIPTSEEEFCEPISNYGASKLAGEGYISSFAHTYGIKGTILRLANIYGERSTHGVMHDFFFKLKENPNELEILGDGKQEKSYLHISDCVNAIMIAWKKQEKIVDYFNVGSDEKTDVISIAKKISKELEINPKFRFTGGRRGWVGDVPMMLLNSNKLNEIGWENKIDLNEGIKRYIMWLKERW